MSSNNIKVTFLVVCVHNLIYISSQRFGNCVPLNELLTIQWNCHLIVYHQITLLVKKYFANTKKMIKMSLYPTFPPTVFSCATSGSRTTAWEPLFYLIPLRFANILKVLSTVLLKFWLWWKLSCYLFNAKFQMLSAVFILTQKAWIKLGKLCSTKNKDPLWNYVK